MERVASGKMFNGVKKDVSTVECLKNFYHKNTVVYIVQIDNKYQRSFIYVSGLILRLVFK